MKIPEELEHAYWDLVDVAVILGLKDHYEKLLLEDEDAYTHEDDLANGIRTRGAIQMVLKNFMWRGEYNEWLQDVQRREPDILA